MILDIPVLKSFVAVVEAGGFTRAAERVHLTQSAVSLHVKRLEEVTGKRLLDRTSRSVALTADGELLLAYARRILSLHDEAGARLGAPDLEGELRFGVPEYVRPEEMTRMIARFHRAHPKVRLEIRDGHSLDLVELFRTGALDLTIAVEMPGNPVGELLWREPRRWFAGEAAEPDPKPWAQSPLPLCVFTPPCVTRRTVIEALDAIGLAWRVVYTSPSATGLAAAVRAGLGVTALPASAVSLGLVPIDASAGLPALSDYRFALYGAGPDASPAVRQFAQEVRTVLTGRGAMATAA